MIAEWMMYCVLASVGLAVAATLAERVLLAGRGPVRMVWIGAVALSIVIPVIAYRFSAETANAGVTPAATVVVTDTLFDAITSPAVTSTPAVALTPPGTPTPQTRDWRALLNRYDQPLLIIWATLSFALACNFLASVFVLMRMRRSWKLQTLNGIPVFMSELSGPAVVGALSPVIVLPKWALGLAAPQLELMLRHEEQHRLAGDGQLLTIAKLALIVMPWNVALWWQILRLRVAVELDCDARVLQSADARVYGALLLEVASTSRGGQLLGATAFAERATQLERRIRVLARHRVQTSHAAKAVALGVGVVVLTVAWVAPHPAVPPGAVTPNPVTSTNVTTPPAPGASAPSANVEQAPAAQTVSGDAMVTSHGIVQADAMIIQLARAKADSAKNQRVKERVDSALLASTPTVQMPPLAPPPITATDTAIVNGARRAQLQQTDSALAILFEGITLTPAQLERARTLIVVLQTQQATQNLTFQLSRTLAQSARDSVLRSLLPEAERAILNPRLTPGGRGARSGGGGALPDPTNGGLPGARSGNAGGGRGGGTGARGAVDSQIGNARGNATGNGRGGAATPQQLESAADATFQRMFDGISLTPAQDSVAHAAILKHLQSMVSTTPPPALIRVNLFTRTVAVAAPADSALVGFASSANDKALIRSRLTAVPPP